ncbi:MAG: hypothetical protein WA628_14625 [Terriglobales bacterium]
MKGGRRIQIVLLLVVVALSGGSGPGLAQDARPDAQPAAAARRTFTEADGVRLMNELQQALNTNNRSRFLKTFDAKRMPGYTAFRDQVAEFFEKYDGFEASYHVTQVAMDGEFGALLADFELYARPSDGVTPSARKKVRLRLVTSWNGAQWKIADLSPRSWLE